MGREKIIAEQLSDILPDRPRVPGYTAPKEELVQREAQTIKSKQDAKEIARLKYAEQKRLRSLEAQQEKRQALAEELGIDEIPDGQTEIQAKRIAEQKNKIETLEAIEAQTINPLNPIELANAKGASYSPKTIYTATQMQGTSRKEVTKLLTSLNINMNLQLTKQDTANLLACLLTCNETQLTALMNNKKIPIVIKTVIKRLIEDVKLGNIETVEKLWDRVFGKGPMQLNLPEQQQLQTGIIPDMPISREAYIVIRDTLIK